MCVDDRQNPQLPAQDKLFMDEILAQTWFGAAASWRSSRSFAFTRRFGCLFLSCKPNSL